MKNNKSHTSGRSRPSFRPSAPSAKTRDGKESRPTTSYYTKAKGEERLRKTCRFQKDFRKESSEPGEARPSEKTRFGEKPKFAGKPKFGDKSRPAFRKAPPERKEEAYKPAGNSVLIWGLHAARAAFLNPKRRITRLWLTEAGQKLFDTVQNEARDELLKRPDAKRMERDDLDRITPSNSVHQGIVIEAEPLPDPALHDIIAADPPPDLILMLDQVTDPHNVGAILRSAAAFGAGALVLTERNAPAMTGVLAKSASGALEVTPMIHVVNLARSLDDLREAGYWCVGLAEEGGKNLGDLDLSGRTVLVLGAEGEGLRHLTRQKCDELARLPTQGPIGSLNVSNAAAVALYEVRKQAK
jgi:23S rRNA (guanosine2251-2'-O)-methyltransferase